jgi:hypothetical protein
VGRWVEPAIELHERIGARRKQDRLAGMRELWARPLSELPGVSLLKAGPHDGPAASVT